MTENISRQPKGIPAGGQFAATAHSEPEASLAPLHTASEEEQHRLFWERAEANAAERAERIRQHEVKRLANLEARRARGEVLDEDEPETYEYIPEAVPPVHTGMFRRAFAAVRSFGTFVDERHDRDMAEIAALSRGGSMVPKFLRRSR
jgi:hypothetical protein